MYITTIALRRIPFLTIPSLLLPIMGIYRTSGFVRHPVEFACFLWVLRGRGVGFLQSKDMQSGYLEILMCVCVSGDWSETRASRGKPYRILESNQTPYRRESWEGNQKPYIYTLYIEIYICNGLGCQIEPTRRRSAGLNIFRSVR